MKTLSNRVAELERLLMPTPTVHVIDAVAGDPAALYAEYIKTTPKKDRAGLVVLLCDATIRELS